MHLSTYVFDQVSILPTKRTIRRIRRRWSQREFLPRWLLALTILIAILTVSTRSRRSRIAPPLSPKNGLASCFQVPITRLSTFDAYMLSLKAAGVVENNVENRWQEDIWDTILHKISLFPAWSDMRWNVPQYARGLPNDLAQVQAIAAGAVSRRGLAVVEPLPPFQSAESAVVVNYVHHRLDRLRGLQYVVNFVTRDERRNWTSFNLLVQKPLDDSKCQVSLASSVSSDPVYILLPYSARQERLRLFFQNYLELRTTYGENLVLIVSLLRTKEEDARFVSALKHEIFGDGVSASVAESIWVHQNDGDVGGGFSRGVALREAAKLVPSADSIIFHCDVDMMVLPSFFDRCRHNTVRGSQVYYPVFYSLYPYANAQPNIVERNGFWRKTSFGMTCIRKSDFQAVGAYDDAETRFHGWGSEDVYQFEKIRNMTNLVAFRAVEPALMHRWHSKACDKGTSDYKDCMKTNFMTMGHPLRVGPLLLESLQDVDQFLANLEHL